MASKNDFEYTVHRAFNVPTKDGNVFVTRRTAGRVPELLTNSEIETRLEDGSISRTKKTAATAEPTPSDGGE